MGKEFVNQHIVPKRYLDRFSSKVDGKNIIGTRFYVHGKPKFFLDSTSNVGYIKNFYDVKDRDDPKYWEHFFAEEIDTLCGSEMENIISSATLSQNNKIVLSYRAKEVLSKVIIAQMMRVPSSFDHVKKSYPKIEKNIIDSYSFIIPKSLLNKYGNKIKDKTHNAQWQKEQFLNHSFAPENFERYCNLVFDGIWVVYVNTLRKEIPFITSDNPVLVEGIGTSQIGLFQNGLANPTTCIFFPLSPEIAVANYSKNGIMEIARDEMDGKKVCINELKFIIHKNINIMKQAYHHTFIPHPMIDEIMNNKYLEMK